MYITGFLLIIIIQSSSSGKDWARKLQSSSQIRLTD